MKSFTATLNNEKIKIKARQLPKEIEFKFGKNTLRFPTDPVRDLTRRTQKVKGFDNPHKEKFLEFWNRIISESINKKQSPEATSIMWEIVKPPMGCRTRELGFIGDVTRRYLNVGKPAMLKKSIRTQIAISYPFQTYVSLTLIRHLPERCYECNSYFQVGQSTTKNKIACKSCGHEYDPAYIIKEELKRPFGFDFIADIDAENLTKAHKHTSKVLKFFKEGDPRRMFSGKKGFHIGPQFKDLKNYYGLEDKGEYSQDYIREFYLKLTDDIKKKTKIKVNIDHATKKMQLIGCPLTPHAVTNLIRVPLNQEEFDAFPTKSPEKVAGMDAVFSKNWYYSEEIR